MATAERRHTDQIVVVCAGTRWDGVPMSERHIADRLTRWCRVVYVDPPISVFRALRTPGLRAAGLTSVRPGLMRLTPVVLPGLTRPGMVRVTEALVRLYIRWALARIGARASFRVVASALPVFGPVNSERRVLYATDDFAAGAGLMGLPVNQVRRQEARLAKETDLVIAISEPIAEKWRAMGCNVVVVPNGCDAERFADTDIAPLPADVRLPPPIAGFAGQINERLDVTLLEAVAARGHSVLLVGPASPSFYRSKLASLLRRSNVQWVGSKAFEAMPSYLRSMHIGLTPYADTPFNRASVPLKTIEYLAAGRAVVSTDLPAARALAAAHVTLAATPDQFADAVGARLKEPLDPSLVAQRMAAASTHSWAARARQFAAAIGLDGQTEAPTAELNEPAACRRSG